MLGDGEKRVFGYQIEVKTAKIMTKLGDSPNEKEA